MQELNEIESLLRKGNKEKAFELIKDMDFITSNLLINEALFFGNEGEEDLSATYLEIAVRIEEDSKTKNIPRLELAMIYASLGMNYAHKKEYQKAIKNCNKALELDTNNNYALIQLALIWNSLNNFNRAIEVCNFAIIINPDIAENHYHRGLIYSNFGQWENAIKDYSIAVELKPNLSDAYINRGNAYGHLKLYTEALESYNKAIELNPNSVEAYHNRGNVYREIKDCDKSVKDYNKSLKLDPAFAPSYFGLGLMYTDLEELDKALENYNIAIDINPSFGSAYVNRANVFNSLKQYKKAIKDCEKVIELYENHEKFFIENWDKESLISLAYNNRGSAYGSLKKHEKAIEDYKKAIEIFPGIDLAYRNLGIVYCYTNKNLDEAIKNFKKAREIFRREYDREEMLSLIAWAKARKEMNQKRWNKFREHMGEVKEILDRIKPADWPEYCIRMSYFDEKLDNVLSIINPKEALKQLNVVLSDFLKESPKIKLFEPEASIFMARLKSFTILYVFLDLIINIDENSDLENIQKTFIELREKCKKIEKDFEATNFTIGKRGIVDIEDIIHRDGTEILEEIGKFPKTSRKEVAINKLTNSWSKLSTAISALNGLSSYEIQNIFLQRQIYEKINKTEVGMQGLCESNKRIETKLDDISGTLKDLNAGFGRIKESFEQELRDQGTLAQEIINQLDASHLLLKDLVNDSEKVAGKEGESIRRFAKRIQQMIENKDLDGLKIFIEEIIKNEKLLSDLIEKSTVSLKNKKEAKETLKSSLFGFKDIIGNVKKNMKPFSNNVASHVAAALIAEEIIKYIFPLLSTAIIGIPIPSQVVNLFSRVSKDNTTAITPKELPL
ncbi:MAG: tetratricopeptide repeat protein [Candidatus Methanoperedens sp.]|nr:tetratricopeptide repeat protein [Candidatus Methanoperedens sp.]